MESNHSAKPGKWGDPQTGWIPFGFPVFNQPTGGSPQKDTPSRPSRQLNLCTVAGAQWASGDAPHLWLGFLRAHLTLGGVVAGHGAQAQGTTHGEVVSALFGFAAQEAQVANVNLSPHVKQEGRPFVS